MFNKSLHYSVRVITLFSCWWNTPSFAINILAKLSEMKVNNRSLDSKWSTQRELSQIWYSPKSSRLLSRLLHGAQTSVVFPQWDSVLWNKHANKSRVLPYISNEQTFNLLVERESLGEKLQATLTVVAQNLCDTIQFRQPYFCFPFKRYCVFSFLQFYFISLTSLPNE